MMPATAPAMRAALDARIVSQAAVGGLDAGRLRRRLVFQRVLRRLSDDDRWVLKGGYLLETRLAAGARATRDLDLVSAEADDVDRLRDALGAALGLDPDGDFFDFAIMKTGSLAADQAGRGGWRVHLEARLAGRVFDRIHIDVMARVTEVDGAVEILEVASPISGVDFAPARVLVVDVAQHAAEKFHALCRTYSGARPSSRVKDLVDIALMSEAGLLPDPRLGSRIRAVFLDRDGDSPPPGLPEFPASWAHDYRTLTADLPVSAPDVESAAELAGQLYREALN